MRIAALLLLPLAALAADLPLEVTRPEDVGMSADRLQRVSAHLQRYIDAGEISGAVSLVARRGKVVHYQAQGYADIASEKPMEKDAIFSLASMTKPVASLAAMMLLEEGRFLLDDPIYKWLPEYEHMQVAVPNKPNERGGPGYRLVPAVRPITIRHLLSHSAGLPSGTSGVTMDDYRKLRELRSPEKPINEYVTALAGLPLNFQPGDAWEYGPATDVLGRLIEVISGQPLDEFFAQRIFKPLGMTDTFFYLPKDRLPRQVTAYKRGENGLEVLDRPRAVPEDGKSFSGAGGLSGTAADYLRLSQMFLNGGELDGVRLLSRKSVESMTVNQIGDARLWQNQYPGYGFGLGFRVRLELGRSPTLGSVGEYGWGGAYGTYFFIDPEEELIGILMIQLIPYDHLNLRPEFQNMVNQAIVD